MKLRTMVLSGMALSLVGMGSLFSARVVSAEEPAPGSAMMQGQMKPGTEAKAASPKGKEMPQACREMMASRESMREERAKNNAKLNELAAKMNAATGEKKVDAIAAVVSEMVAQRQATSEKMATMHTKWKKAMEECPMMKEGAGGAPSAPAQHKAK
jgi:hypothetical protein